MSLNNNNNYLKKYYRYNNPILNRFKINNKIDFCMLGFIICSIIYIIMTYTGIHRTLDMDSNSDIAITNTTLYIDIIMYVCYVLGAIGVIYFILKICVPSFIEAKVSNIKFVTKRKIYDVMSWAIILPVCCVIATFCYSYLFSTMIVEGVSMEPTIIARDDFGNNTNPRVFVTYGNKKLKQFDIVVLKVTPEDNVGIYADNYYIKRIIGLPGQTVKWVNKTLYINGQVVDEKFYDSNYYESINNTKDFNGEFTYFDKNGNQVKTDIIPEGYFFVMGDNREAGRSYDSRDIGLIPQENIIGKAKWLFTSLFKWEHL